MPIYEFHCEKCGSDFEQLFPSSTARASAPCAKCGARKTRRKLSLFGMSSGSRSSEPRSSTRSSCASCSASSCAGCRK